jgi:hypothetical protein
MNEKMMEIPRLGSFDQEYGRKNGKLILPQSLWTDTKQESVDTTPFRDNTETDVTIIGGGITGLSAALHLREQGYAVTVLEAGEIGWGGSGRNGGHFNPGWKVKRVISYSISSSATRSNATSFATVMSRRRSEKRI